MDLTILMSKLFKRRVKHLIKNILNVENKNEHIKYQTCLSNISTLTLKCVQKKICWLFDQKCIDVYCEVRFGFYLAERPISS